MSVEQSLREVSWTLLPVQLWSQTSFASVALNLREPIELRVVDAVSQQDVPECFQQPAKAISEEVCVMRGPQAEAWKQAVLDEVTLFQKLGVYAEVPKSETTTILCRLGWFWLVSPILVEDQLGTRLGLWSAQWISRKFIRMSSLLLRLHLVWLPKMVEVGVVQPGVAWKMQKALYGPAPR